MIRIDDERISFYLKHRHLIEQWAAIKEDIPPVAHRFMMSLRPDVADIASAYGVRYYVSEEERYPKLFLVREAWPLLEKQPLVGIGVEWIRAKTNFWDKVPYVGVWTNGFTDEGKTLCEKLKDYLASSKLPNGYRPSPPFWASHKHIFPEKSDPLWDNLDPYRNRLIEHVHEAWNLFANEVDRALP